MLNEGLGSLKGAVDISVDVMELSRKKDVSVVAKEDPDATENSSSFADTISGNENYSGLSDAEVESHFFGDSALAPQFDGFGSVFPVSYSRNLHLSLYKLRSERRKKKLSAHWRNFIHPLMWRCKWTELKIKELESQAAKYAREISVYDHGKHIALDQTTVEESGSKSLPFTHLSRRRRPMKRMKRKRVEFATDIASYMSNHIAENKRGDLDGVAAWENLGNSDQHAADHDDFGIHDDCVFPEDHDDFLEHILRKIELAHARVYKLKDQLSSVMINNPSKFASSEDLSQLVQTSSLHNSPTLSACNGDNVSIGGSLYTSPQHITDYDLGDIVFPDSAVSSFGEDITIPDITESTVGLLSSKEVTHHHAQFGDSSERIVDNILVKTEAAEVEDSTFKYALDAENSGEDEEEEDENNNAVLSALEQDTLAKGVVVSTELSTLKSCLSSEIHFPKNKRKRGERKAGSGNWSRQRPGEPES